MVLVLVDVFLQCGDMVILGIEIIMVLDVVAVMAREVAIASL